MFRFSFLLSFLFLFDTIKCEEEIVNVLVVVDTKSLIEDYQYTASKDPQRPTSLPHKYSFMIAPNKYVIKRQASADLVIKNIVGDSIRWSGVSEKGNFDSVVIVYKIVHNTKLLGNSELDFKDAISVEPLNKEMKQFNYTKFNSIMVQAQALAEGKVNYFVHFAVFARNRKNRGKQELVGYFEWDPVIEID